MHVNIQPCDRTFNLYRKSPHRFLVPWPFPGLTSPPSCIPLTAKLTIRLPCHHSLSSLSCSLQLIPFVVCSYLYLLPARSSQVTPATRSGKKKRPVSMQWCGLRVSITWSLLPSCLVNACRHAYSSSLCTPKHTYTSSLTPASIVLGDKGLSD